MTVRIERYDGNEMSLIARKVAELEARVAAHGTLQWDTHEDPDLDHRPATEVVMQMMKRRYPMKEEPPGTVNIPRKR